MHERIDRRRFIGRAGAGAAGAVLATSAARVHAAQSDTALRLAVVGIAGYGAFHGFAQAIHTYDNVQFAMSCDVDMRKVKRVYDFWDERAEQWSASEDEAQRRAAAQHYGPLAKKRPPLYADFRRMLDEAADQFDAVVIATPDHTHAVIAAAALRAGKPVFVEKPLTISAHEARALHALAKQTGLPTQMNNHGAASSEFRRGVELIREGALGTVREVHVFFSRGGANFVSPPQGSQAVPAELDWNLWLAQLKWRDYHERWINRIGWRESSIGELGNFAPHSANMAFMALGVKELWDAPSGGPPIRIGAECSDINQLSYPRWEKIRWDVPARGKLPAVSIIWHHGPRQENAPPEYAPGSRQMFAEILRDHGATDAELKDLLPYAGCLIVGDHGVLATGSHNTSFTLLPKQKFSHLELRRPLRMPTSPGHYREWIDACRGGAAPISNLEYASPFAEFLNVGSISTRFPGETLEFDPAAGRITNHGRADELLAYEYRDGWTI